MIAHFVLRLTAGIALMWLLMPRREVTDGFFRIQMRLVLGLAVLAVLVIGTGTAGQESEDSGLPAAAASVEASNEAMPEVVLSPQPSWLSRAGTPGFLRGLMIAVAVLSYIGSIVWALGRRVPGGICIRLIGVFSVSAMLLNSLQVSVGSPIWVRMAAELGSAGVLGSLLTGMLLGHWYLTTPTMSIRPLWWFTWAVAGAGLLRGLAGAAAWLTSDVTDPGTMHLSWLALRYLGGVITPVVVAVMVRQILKHRNTQSATGVLFAGLIVAFMGEMTGILLEHDLGVPL